MTHYAVYILMRTDLNMSRGKMCAQACHAVTDLMLFGIKDGNEEVIREWFNDQGQTKVTLAVDSEEELEQILEKCASEDIPYSEVVDEGRTELEGDYFTVMGIGPVDRRRMGSITGHLQALR